VGGVPALRLDAGPDARIILWFHGGAYCIGSPRTHAALVAALAMRIGAGAVLPDYRMAPEDPVPAAPKDALAAEAGLMGEGIVAGRSVLGGAGAGGGLAFAALHLALAEGLPPPAAVVAFCPWADRTGRGASRRTNARRDALIPVQRFAEIRDMYL